MLRFCGRFLCNATGFMRGVRIAAAARLIDGRQQCRGLAHFEAESRLERMEILCRRASRAWRL